nr:PEPxxWA-CTERM sorting domain-containing protein [Sphingobium xanthum]
MTFVSTLGGRLNTGLDNISLTPLGAIPEPASWALMIGGFALAGAAMRRSKTSVSFA